MKSNKRKRILAIDPGTRNIGYAVFENRDLKYFGVKTIPRPHASHGVLSEGKKIMARLLADFSPTVVAVERTYFGNNRGSVTLNRLVQTILSTGERRGLDVLCLPVNTIRKRVCGNGWAQKAQVVKMLCREFPQLRAYGTSNREWKRDFNQNIFDAVALGVAAGRDRAE